MSVFLCSRRLVVLVVLHCICLHGEIPAQEPAGREPSGPQNDLRAWLESMAVNHGYSRDEIAQATGLSTEAVERSLKEFRLTPGEAATKPPSRAADGSILVLPYPGGRHPRIGFLEGAIEPRRDTKASIFLPWDDAGYAVIDLPEALWSNLGLTFLAHTHIPTVWDKQNIKLERGEWTRKPGGVLENSFPLPNGIRIDARAIPRKDAVDMELRLRNGTPERLTGLRTQICLMLKGAPAFNEQTNDNKVIAGRAIATRSKDGKRWIATAWERAKPWANPPCPCMHSDPVFPDLEPGAEAALRGRVFFFEGDDIRAEISRREGDGTLAAEPYDPPAEILSVRKIWDRAPHNAFTDLVRFEDAWFCTFREGAGHVSPDGALRVITSADGETWTSAALITSPAGDLRDPKLAITPDGRLQLSGASALHPPAPHKHQSLVWFSKDGRAWGEPTSIGDPDLWIWRIQWHAGAAHGIGYATDGRKLIRVYRSSDGAKFERIADNIFDRGEPNESSLVFLDDGTAHCILRRDDPGGLGQIGTARPPYTSWTWQSLGARIGGPHMIRLPGGRFVAAARLYDGKVRTSLASVDPATGRFHEILALPSGGDTSYPGLVFRDGVLWVSYYSSHEGKTSIYLARVKL